MKSKKRETWFLTKMDTRVQNKIKKEAAKRGISVWLLTEYLLTEALGLDNAKSLNKLFSKT